MNFDTTRARPEVAQLLHALVDLNAAEAEMLKPNDGDEFNAGYIDEYRLDQRNEAAARFSEAFDKAVRSVPKDAA